MTILSWFQNPYWLIALVFVPLAFFFLKPSGYIAKTYTVGGGTSWSTRVRLGIPHFSFLFAAAVIIIALADPTKEYVVMEEKFIANRIFVSIDQSSSMYNFTSDATPIYCADKNLNNIFPRIDLACKALYRLIDDTAAFAEKNNVKQITNIGLLRFALYSRVLAYPINDYKQLRAIVDELNWRREVEVKGSYGRDIFTEIHLALWDMFLLAIKRNEKQDDSLAYFSDMEKKELALALYPESNLNAEFHLPGSLEEKLAKIKEELRDTVFVILTDAFPSQLEGRYNKKPVSFKKMVDLAEFLELPIYIISSDADNALFKKEIRRTGSGPAGGKYRGDFLVMNRGSDDPTKELANLVSMVLETRLGRTTPVPVEHRKSYAPDLALLALTFLIFGLISRETLVRSLSDE